MKHKLALAALALLLSFTAYSGPAMKGPVHLSQPDGTCFSAKIRGDEYMKVITTAAGNAIIQDADGWWCYARYDSDGGKCSSGWRVGADAPADVVSLSRIIPFNRLAANAGLKKNAVMKKEKPLMKRILEQKGIDTKSTATKTVTKHGLIILAQFRDEKFQYTREDFVNMLTKEGYSLNGAAGSAKEYFDDQFNGLFEFSFDVSSMVTLPNDMKYYGGNDKYDSDSAPEEMIIDACRLVDDEIDFSLYDDDGDGEVDNVFVFFAGGDEAEGAGDDRIWSHAWYVYDGADKSLILDGKRINRYACTAELSRRYSSGKYSYVLAGIGTFCHEYFHTFGIPDLYDTDYEESGGTAAAMWGSTSLMDSGNQNDNGNRPPYLNAIEREHLGISEAVTISNNGSYSLEPINQNGRFYRIDTDNKDEYYILEYRGDSGWDSHIGGTGMLVYHIDKSDRNSGNSETFGMNLTAAQRWSDTNEVNARPAHQCADIIEADSRQDGFSSTQSDSFYASMENIRGIFFPTSKINSLTPDSKPGITHWSGSSSLVSITNIRKNDNGVTFNVLGFEESELPPAVASNSVEAFADAAIIQFESDRIFDGEAVVEWGRSGENSGTIRVNPYEPGRYSVTLEGLQAGNRTYTVNIHFEHNGLTGKVDEISFMTKKKPAVEWPYIYMGGVTANSDGTLPSGTKLPLRVYNAAGAAEIKWTFKNAEITVGGDGYFTVTKSGTLKAHLIWEDGSEEIIMKEIIIGEEVQQ